MEASAELKDVLERSLGFKIASFTRLKCVNSVNYKAVRASDGLAFTVKALPESRKAGYELILTHLKDLEGTKAPIRLFEKECPATFKEYHLVCLKWCEGRGVFPDLLSSSELKGFLDDYAALIAKAQGARAIVPAYPVGAWRAEALEACKRGMAAKWFRRLCAEIPEELSDFKPDRLRITHGDLHPGNIAFKNGVVTGFLDVEGLTWGYPVWDLVRYFHFALTKLPLLKRQRRQLVWTRFAEAVSYFDAPLEDWLIAINATFFEQVWKKGISRGPKLIGVAQLAFRAREFRKMRAICTQVKRG